MRPLHQLERWIYRGDRPSRIATRLNDFWARRYRSGGRLSRTRDVTLEVRGRTSGRPIEFPAVLADHEGHWYAVSMLGAHANWVRNLRAADGTAIVRHGTSHPVHLREIPVAERAPILQRYLQVAPGARPHLPIDQDAPIADFERIAADFPVFEVEGFVAAD